MRGRFNPPNLASLGDLTGLHTFEDAMLLIRNRRWNSESPRMDDVPVAKIKDFQDKLQDFFLTRKESLLTAIREKKAVDDSISGDLKAATEEFKLSYK